MEKKILFPDEPILLIQFYKFDKFKSCLFNSIEYQIIGEDDVGNLIGVDSDGKVYCLDIDLEIAVYMATNVKILIMELQLYKKYCAEYVLPDNPSDDELEAYSNDFKQRLKKLDSFAFNDENNFWSVISEQMETEQL